MQESVAATSACRGLTLNLALSYSARWELAAAARKIAAEAAAGRIAPTEIDETVFSSYLTTSSIPDPDLLIRTGGDVRVSNFLLWQIAYTELIFSTTFWPDYGDEQFLADIAEFQRRERRFGKTSSQIAGESS